VTDQKQAQLGTQALEQEAVLPLRMPVVIELHSVFIIEDCARFFEGDAVFFQIGAGLLQVPDKAQFFHTYIVTTRKTIVNSKRVRKVSGG